MQSSIPIKFNFELLTCLAKESPAEFARVRHDLSADALGKFSDREEGARLQMQIDADRLSVSSPKEVCASLLLRAAEPLPEVRQLVDQLEGLLRLEVLD